MTREASHIAVFDLDDTVWRVGLAPVGPDRWNELVAAHAVREDAPQQDRAAAEEEFHVDLVANTVVWEQYDTDHEDARELLNPGDVAAWADKLTSDVWASLVEQVYRVSGPSGWEWATERLRKAPMLALEMAVAREYRLPHSALMRWSEDDRALAIADLIETRATCIGCGVPQRATRDYDAATVEVDGCVWCGMLAQARREATEEQHPRIQLKRGY